MIGYLGRRIAGAPAVPGHAASCADVRPAASRHDAAHAAAAAGTGTSGHGTAERHVSRHG